MSNQPQAAPNASEPRLCKMGCGFFGSGATGDCCSKCWGEHQKKAEKKAVAAVKECQTIEEPSPMEVEEPMVSSPSHETTSTIVEKAVETAPSDAAPAKKKKKKANYKSMMAGMIQSPQTRDVEKEKEQLRKVTGGGAFSKIDKI
ncbi:hypothetical protein ACA910_017210 [Epithemia clementina (nom. ined.)]